MQIKSGGRGAGRSQTAKMGAEQQRGSVQGGGNKSNREIGGRATEGCNANGPAVKEEGSWRLKAQTEYALESCRVAQC